MHHLMFNLPVFGTLGVVALLAGPLASWSIDAGAWVLERCVYTGARVLKGCLPGKRRSTSSLPAEPALQQPLAAVFGKIEACAGQRSYWASV
jgi:hypothetical protein